MRKALTITLVAALALFAGSAAYANYCARDVVPASTILVPYAVQSMLNEETPSGAGYATILTITNVSADAQIIHITVWNAISEAVLDFNEVLTGYDVWQINFRDMIAGNFGFFDTSQTTTATLAQTQSPNTGNRQPFEWGPDGRSAYLFPANPVDGLPLPETAGPLPDIECFMPYENGLDVSSNVANLHAPLFSRSHAGCGTQDIRSDFENDWLHNISDDWGDDLWFYVTVDLVNVCNFAFPYSTGYFENLYVNENVLIGDIVYLNSTENFSEAISAVHIESDPPNASDGVNFYEELNSGTAAASELEPLATGFAFNYYNFDALDISTNVIVWKNFADFIIGGPEDEYVDDCGYYMYYTWDFDEHTESRSGSCNVSPCDPNDIDPNEFPFETQSVPVTIANFDLVGVPGNQQGWMLILFPPTYINTGVWADPTPSNPTHPLVAGNPPGGNDDQDIYMAWVGVKYTYAGYSAAIEAATIANTHCFAGDQLVQLGVNPDRDGGGAPAE